MAPYHKFVFNIEKRQHIGQYEQMYQAENSEGFDSWFERDLTHLRKTISLTILSAYNFSRILDVGCGKGSFTHLLKRYNNRVVGIDISETAVQKGRESFPAIDFRCINAHELPSLGETFDLVVVMGTFAYVDGWPKVVETIAAVTRWFYVAEYIPANTIGYVKSADQLITEVEKNFVLRTKVLLNDEHCMLLGEVGRTGDCQGRE